MRLYSRKNLRDYRFLEKKYSEVCVTADMLMRTGIEGAELKFALKQLDLLKDMMEKLGVEVPDDKAKELGFGEELGDE